jgi:methanogenic corrinoid protein MtbC1
MTTEIREKLFKLFLLADRRGANRLIDNWAKDYGYEQAVLEILEPTLELFGEHWAADEDVSLAQGYIAAKIAEDVMLKYSRTWEHDIPSQSRGTIVIGNIEDDYHALGRKLVVTFLRSSGWNIVDLGNDVLAPQFVDKALEVNASIIAASAMMGTTAVNIKKLRREIDDRGMNGKIQLAVGGAVFRIRPEMVSMVGGDGTARNAIEVPGLMETLKQRSDQCRMAENE